MSRWQVFTEISARLLKAEIHTALKLNFKLDNIASPSGEVDFAKQKTEGL